VLDLAHNRIVRGEINEPIKRWETWWKTPWGLAQTYDEAFKTLEDAEIDKNLAMKPIPVAISETTHEAYDP
jgi:hypothetical protein